MLATRIIKHGCPLLFDCFLVPCDDLVTGDCLSPIVLIFPPLRQAAHADKKIVQLSCFVAERMLQEISMLDHLPSVIACSAIYVARKNMGRTCWSPTLEKYTKYHVEDLIPCLTEVRLGQLGSCHDSIIGELKQPAS